MATKKIAKSKIQKVDVNEPSFARSTTLRATEGQGKCCCGSRWVGFGWVILLIGGLAHMLPEQMAPILKWSLFGISVQLAVGVISVILALNFLLEE